MSRLPGRAYLNTSLTSSTEKEEITQHGYLNRKCEGSVGARKTKVHRDKNWQLYWCNLKGPIVEFYKCDTIKLKPGDPPPKDVIPPTNLAKTTKMEQLNVEGALVELDYVSQENKDIQKRRKFLFRMVLKNDVEYIMQASNPNQRNIWVSSLQAVAHNMPLEMVDVAMGPGHAIKSSRDSIKHLSKQVHRTRKTIQRGTVKTSTSGPEDSDYIEFSTAEAMVAAGGDPRLQALRKRLQAKKELLKQLNRMYTSFLGGNAAAMYDETLMLQQVEPPTFDGMSPVLSTAPGPMPSQVTKRMSKKPTYQVVHRKLTLTDSNALKQQGRRSSSEPGYQDEADGSGPAALLASGEEEKRGSVGERGSTGSGEMNVPALLTAVSPIHTNKEEDVFMETELLIDYYLVPGAEWSLIKKGETVQIIGKTRDNSWYRCMALRDSKVKLDRTPFSFMIRSIVNPPTPGGGAGLGEGQAGITPEMIDAEYAQRNLEEGSFSLKESAPQLAADSFRDDLSPPPLLPRSVPATSPLTIHTIAPSSESSETSMSDVDPRKSISSVSPDPEGGGGSMRESPDLGAASGEELIPGAGGVGGGGRDSREKRVSSLALSSPEPSNGICSITEEQEPEETRSLEEDDEPHTPARIERRLSYQLATEEDESDSLDFSKSREEQGEVGGGALGGREKEKEVEKNSSVSSNNKQTSEIIKRSSSSVERSSAATITLRRTLNSGAANNQRGKRAARAVSSSVEPSYAGRLSPRDRAELSSSSLGSYRPPTTSLDNLIDKEINTGTYSAPLIGCIPPSALKCFAEGGTKEEGKGKEGSPMHSPSHSQSDLSGSGGTSANQSRPASDAIDPPASDHTPSAPAAADDSKASSGVNDEEPRPKGELVTVSITPVEGNSPSNERKHSNAHIVALRGRDHSMFREEFTQSTSLSDDSDGEADRRQNLIFKKYDTIDPTEDADLLKTRALHMRAKSLPPPMHVRVEPPASGEGGEEANAESSLDRKPSYLRGKRGSVSPEPYTQIAPPHSVGSSPLHQSNSTHMNGNVGSKPPGRSEQSIGSLFESPSRQGLFKKLFSKRNKSPKTNLTPEHTATNSSSSVSPSPALPPSGPAPGLLKQVLLGKTDPFLEDQDEVRVRLSSVSGKPVVHRGMGLVIGESSSESEEEEEEEEEDVRSNVSSLFEDTAANSSVQPTPPTSPTPSDKPANDPLFRSLNQGDLKDMFSKRSAVLGLPEPGRLQRSASDHALNSTSLHADAKKDSYSNRPGNTSSLKRNTNTMLFAKKQRKPRTMTAPVDPQSAVKKNRLSKKKKKSLLSNYEVEKEEAAAASSLEQEGSPIKLSGIIRQPPRGEKRYVYLDPHLGKYGFRLQSYGRIRDQGKVLQTFVQSVITGSPSFMAGLYPGDTIVEVNGVDVKYAPVESVVGAIQEGSKDGRVALKVEFVDGVTRLDCMRKADEFKEDIKQRQRRLNELRQSEESLPLPLLDQPQPQLLSLARELPVWATGIPDCEATKHKFPYNRRLNEMVAVHMGAINALDCDVLVMPISSCYKNKTSDNNDKNILLQLLRTGGPKLLDELSLAKQCKIGENISTSGHSLPARHLYHCVFGDLEESLQSCCREALQTASANKMRTIVFWLDGFASLSVSPHMVIDTVRNWLQQDAKHDIFDRVVFSSKANVSLVEKFMHSSFPLFPSATRNSGASFTEQPCAQQNGIESMQNVIESLKNGNVEPEASQNGSVESKSLQSVSVESESVRNNNVESENFLRSGNAKSQNGNAESESADQQPVIDEQDIVLDITEPQDGSEKEAKVDDDDLSTEDLLESLQAIQDQNMKTFEELVQKLAETDPMPVPQHLKVDMPPSMYSSSLPHGMAQGYEHHRYSSVLSPADLGHTRSVSPSFNSSKSRSQSGDLILNPDRTESEV